MKLFIILVVRFASVPSIIGFERSSYSVGEGAGVAEICVLILAPDDPNTLPSSYSATVNISTMQGNAIGRAHIYQCESNSLLTVWCV